MIRRALYNREIVLFERWRILYSPAYGWRWRRWRPEDDPSYCEICDGPCRDES